MRDFEEQSGHEQRGDQQEARLDVEKSHGGGEKALRRGSETADEPTQARLPRLQVPTQATRQEQEQVGGGDRRIEIPLSPDHLRQNRTLVHAGVEPLSEQGGSVRGHEVTEHDPTDRFSTTRRPPPEPIQT